VQGEDSRGTTTLAEGLVQRPPYLKLLCIEALLDVIQLPKQARGELVN
jgi:hypothetical protein